MPLSISLPGTNVSDGWINAPCDLAHILNVFHGSGSEGESSMLVATVMRRRRVLDHDHLIQFTLIMIASGKSINSLHVLTSRTRLKKEDS